MMLKGVVSNLVLMSCETTSTVDEVVNSDNKMLSTKKHRALKLIHTNYPTVKCVALEVAQR